MQQHNLDTVMKNKKIILHRLHGVQLQHKWDEGRKGWKPAYESAKRQGLTASFFKQFLVVEIHPSAVMVFDVVNGATKRCGSIGAAMGHMQGRLFRAGYLL